MGRRRKTLERKSIVQTKHRHTERCCLGTKVGGHLNGGNRVRVKKAREWLCSSTLVINETL